MESEFEGYRVGDVTYCVIAGSTECFPVRVIKVGKRFLEIAPFDDELCGGASVELGSTAADRRFQRPRLPPSARFGGWDERLVNASRNSGPELRLLPTHYGTTTGNLIREHHARDPDRWPLPTGQVFERWFKDCPP